MADLPTALRSPRPVGTWGRHFRWGRRPNGQSGSEPHWTQDLPQAGPRAPFPFSDPQLGHKLDIIVAIRNSELTKHNMLPFLLSQKISNSPTPYGMK